jgi:hypothetical protein
LIFTVITEQGFERDKEDFAFRRQVDEDAATIALVDTPFDQFEPGQAVERACDNRLGNPQPRRKATHRVQAAFAPDDQQQSHLPVGQIRVPRLYIAQQRMAPLAQPVASVRKNGHCLPFLQSSIRLSFFFSPRKEKLQ